MGARHKPKCLPAPESAALINFPFVLAPLGGFLSFASKRFPRRGRHDMKDVRKAKNADIPASFVLSRVLLTPGKLSLRTEA